MKKKFGLNDISMLGITFLIIAIVIGLMATVLTSMTDTSDGNTGWRTTVSVSDDNNTFVALNLTAVNFATDHSSETDFVAASCTAVKIWNATNAADITSQFSVNGCSATLTPVDNLVDSDTVTANYTYRVYQYGAAYNNTKLGQVGLTDLSGWQSTWVVIIAAAVIIGIVGAYLFFKPRG